MTSHNVRTEYRDGKIVTIQETTEEVDDFKATSHYVNAKKNMKDAEHAIQREKSRMSAIAPAAKKAWVRDLIAHLTYIDLGNAPDKGFAVQDYLDVLKECGCTAEEIQALRIMSEVYPRAFREVKGCAPRNAL